VSGPSFRFRARLGEAAAEVARAAAQLSAQLGEGPVATGATRVVV
jgi:DNA-binding IclR family transcriptional regulator